MSQTTTDKAEVSCRPFQDSLRHRLTWSLAICTAAVLCTLPGCITAATIATIAIISNASAHKATVDLDVPPDQVYGAMMRIIDRERDIKVIKNDPSKRLITAERGKNKVTATAKGMGDNKTELTIRVEGSEEGTSDEELALRVEERICDELGVRYRVAKPSK